MNGAKKLSYVEGRVTLLSDCPLDFQDESFVKFL